MKSQPSRPASVPTVVAAALLVALSACSDGSSTDSTAPPASGPFELASTSFDSGDTLPLNRAIELVFTGDVDPLSVSPTTIELLDGLGRPVLGTYTLPTPRTVRFEPACPKGLEPEPGGLAPGTAYTLRVPSTASGTLALIDTAGRALRAGAELDFTTPDSEDPAELFDDGVDGPPNVLIAGLGNVTAGATSYVEFTGQDEDGDGAPDRSLFTFDGAVGSGTIEREVPLNLYSVSESRFAFVLRFDQPVDGSLDNLARVQIEHRDPSVSVQWLPLPSTRELESNCVSSGAVVRLTPLGVVPGGHQLRVVLDSRFADLVGQSYAFAFDDIAQVRVEDSMPEGLVDEILESFDGTELFDPAAGNPNPVAHWDGTGSLDASFGFAGTGGPGGDFDWIVPSGTELVLSTDADTIFGGPDGLPFVAQPVVGGVVNVRDLTVQAGAVLRVVGSQPLTILASGDVRVAGWICADGMDAVEGTPSIFDTTGEPVVGAAGVAGGGAGGNGSPRVSDSSPRGGAGEGAFGALDAGGQGGETGYAPAGTCAKEDRRGAGGGGGRFGPDVRYPWNGALVRSQTLVGMDAERGILGSYEGTGAVSQSDPAQGGAPGPGPFIDLDATNDFFGVLRHPDGTTVRGELAGLWAGAGGGGGGDASTTSVFPITPFQGGSDEKGAGGGGGGGGVEILSLGDIVLEAGGQITADGGNGQGGENTIFFDRVGGGSGGGSGGHIVLASAGRVELRAEASDASARSFYQDDLGVLVHEKRPLRALGGQGGAGRESRCGANEEGAQSWVRDSIPTENFDGDPTIPPQNAADPFGYLDWARVCTLQNHAGCASEGAPGETFGAGGDGGPGLIQIHVQNPTTDIVLGTKGGATGEYGSGGDPTFAAVPPPLGWTGPNDPLSAPVSLFGARSEAVTRWIPLGLARPMSAETVELLFDGTDPATGTVRRDGGAAAELAPLVAETALGAGSNAPSLDVAAARFTFASVTGFDPTGIYRRNPALTRGFAVRVRPGGPMDEQVEFVVQSGTYDEAADALLLTVDPRGAALADAADAFATPTVELVPFFVRLLSDGELDAYPAGSEVRVLFDAARVDPSTGSASIDPVDVFSGGDPAAFTPDITDLSGGDWDLLRVRFEFLLGSSDPAAPRPGLDLFKVHYGY
ncbi:MAG: Ig-like domain-containing protein [Planctomycetota bacterium]